jgi:hypothetical protein
VVSRVLGVQLSRCLLDRLLAFELAFREPRAILSLDLLALGDLGGSGAHMVLLALWLGVIGLPLVGGVRLFSRWRRCALRRRRL